MKGLTGVLERVHFRINTLGRVTGRDVVPTPDEFDPLQRGINVAACGWKSPLEDRFTDDPDDCNCGNCRNRPAFNRAMAKKLRRRTRA